MCRCPAPVSVESVPLIWLLHRVLGSSYLDRPGILLPLLQKTDKDRSQRCTSIVPELHSAVCSVLIAKGYLSRRCLHTRLFMSAILLLTHTHMHTHTHTCTHTCTHVYTHTHTHTSTHSLRLVGGATFRQKVLLGRSTCVPPDVSIHIRVINSQTHVIG